LFESEGVMGEFEWAGVRFLAIGTHDGRRIHAPGLYGFVRRGPGDERVLLFVGHADRVSLAVHAAHPRWAEAVGLGMNEVHVCLKAHARLDRLQLRHHLIRRCGPILNLLAEAEALPVRIAAVG
jgi:hypothetical protein